MRSRHDSLAWIKEAFEDAVAEVLDSPVLLREPSFHLEDSGVDAVADIDGVKLAVQLKAAPSVADVDRLDRVVVPPGAYKVLAGGRVSQAVRHALRTAGIGFFDARGHLRLMHPPLRIDAPVTGRDGRPPTKRDPLATQAGLDVAIGVLDDPHVVPRFGVRKLAGALDRAPSTVSTMLHALRDDYLVDEENRPVVPDLFEAVVARWRPNRVALAGLPRPGMGRSNDRLQLGLDARPLEPGWALADSQAAAAWGAPVVVDADGPPDFYVPSTRVVHAATAHFGAAVYGSHECTVATAPAPFVVKHRENRSRLGFRFPVVRPVVAALDLGADPARGREVLDDWNRILDPTIARVW